MLLQPWIVWFSLAAVLVAVEMISTTFYLLMLAVGLVAGGIAAWLGADLIWQIFVAALVAALAVLILRRVRIQRIRGQGGQMDEADLNFDIGQVIEVRHWDKHGRSRVHYRGTEWDTELQAGEHAEPGEFQIRAVRDNRLIVSRIQDGEKRIV